MEVEAHLQLGVPAFAIVGLADRACQEAKERVRSGIASAELVWPNRRITVNLAPAELRKEGSGFDLPIALAVLAASRQIPPERLAGHAAVGELALDGRLRPVGGALAAAEGARLSGLTRVLCAAESGLEVAARRCGACARAASRRGGYLPAWRARAAPMSGACLERSFRRCVAGPLGRSRPGACPAGLGAGGGRAP